ncbi:hypothetical protein [Leptolyngbya sp. FACHB-541]|nr:hypothetical protein [Leptolyngbya sp. FACHB-541]
MSDYQTRSPFCIWEFCYQSILGAEFCAIQPGQTSSAIASVEGV